MGKIGSCAGLTIALLFASASAPVIPPRQLTEREKVIDAVVKYAKQFNLDANIFMAQCWVESYYKASIVERDPDTGTRISFGPLQVHEEVGERAWIAYGGAGKYAPELCLSPDFGVYAGARHMR